VRASAIISAKKDNLVQPDEDGSTMTSMPRCQDCGSSIKVDPAIGGRRAQSIQFCERCTKQHDTLEAAEKRRTIVLTIATVGVLIALGYLALS
jgi:hypothetical protein